jgi:hypothetical protein
MPLTYMARGLVGLALSACAGAAGVGCVAPLGDPGSGPVEQTGSDLSLQLFTNDQAAYDYFRGKGLQPFQAAGIVGNLDQESGVDPTSVQAGGPGRGIAQWSVGGRWDTDANDNAQWYATQQGQNVESLQLQLDFVWYELTTFSSYGLSSLEGSTNVTDATVAFQNDFEGCGTCDQSTRIAYAQAVLAAYGNDVVDGGVVTPPDASGATPCDVPGVGAGVCITTTQCASMAGFVSTPNYCPGAADIQCCTGPSTPPDAGKADSGSSSGGSSGSGSGSSSGGSGSSGSGSGGKSSSSGSGAGIGPTGDAAVGNDSGSGSGANAGFPDYDSGHGCTTAPGRASGPGGGAPVLLMAALGWTVARRRKKHQRRHGPFSVGSKFSA